MEIAASTKIWRYMDLGRFISMLADRALYFACTTQFVDPFELTVPKSHAAVERQIVTNMMEGQRSIRAEALKRGVPSQIFDGLMTKMGSEMLAIHETVNERFGLSCWHENTGESEAMWKLYSLSGQGIAIESTVGQLRESLVASDPNLIIDRVRYVDFENAPFEKGRANYRLFLKRPSFEHEKEIRATTLLPNFGTGRALGCDLGALITQIHISPLMDLHVGNAIKKLCEGNLEAIKKLVVRSNLYDKPGRIF